MTGSLDWITPGAKVVVYTEGGISRDENPTVTTIAKVAKKSFTVSKDVEPRFSVDRQESALQGGTWGWRRKVVPFDSDEARQMLKREQDRRRIYRARAAVEKWERMRSRENRLAAIAALQAIEVDEGHVS